MKQEEYERFEVYLLHKWRNNGICRRKGREFDSQTINSLAIFVT